MTCGSHHFQLLSHNDGSELGLTVTRSHLLLGNSILEEKTLVLYWKNLFCLFTISIINPGIDSPSKLTCLVALMAEFRVPIGDA